VPYVRDESPFEDLCRELWCSNLTHALRAHPALEGTDCSSKPFPYGSICIEGVCTPWNPDQDERGEDKIMEPSNTAEKQPTQQWEGDYKDMYDYQDVGNSIDGSPAWYDPLYNKIFTNLRKEFERRNPVLEAAGRANERQISNNKRPSEIRNIANDTLETNAAKRGIGQEDADCPVECGGGWVHAFRLCTNGSEIECGIMKPCGIVPCL
jgi:hypothetical protein